MSDSGDAFEVVFTSRAADETRGLPPSTFIALIAALTQVSRNPWDHTRQQDDDHRRRLLEFDAGHGLAALTITIDTNRRTVVVRQVTWIG